jgi:gas vesicle protein
MQNNFNGRTFIGQQNDYSNNQGQIIQSHTGNGDIISGDKNINSIVNNGNIGVIGNRNNMSGTTFTQNINKDNVEELKDMIKQLLIEMDTEGAVSPDVKQKLTKTLNTTSKNIENEDNDNLESNVDVLENINSKLSSATKTVGLLGKVITGIKVLLENAM